MSQKSLMFVQYGLESAHGTRVAATKKWTGEAMSIKPGTKVNRVEDEPFGARAASRRAQVQQYLEPGALIQKNAIWQQLPFLFQCGLKGSVTPTEQTPAQGDYLWDFSPSLTSVNSPKSATLEWGDEDQEWEAGYVMFGEYRISGSISQGPEPSPVSVEADWFGQKKAKSTKTGALSLHTPVGMNAKLARLYMDSLWADLGDTEVANLLRSFQLTIMTGLKPNFTGGPDQNFSHVSERVLGVQLGFTIESGAKAISFLDAYNGTKQFARFTIDGPQIASGVNYLFQLDMASIFDEVEVDSDEDSGVNLSAFTLTDMFDDTSSKLFELKVITDNNAV